MLFRSPGGRPAHRTRFATLRLADLVGGDVQYLHGFDGETMEILHVAAHKVGESQGRKPRAMGRASAWNATQVDVELILEDSEAAEASNRSGGSREGGDT